MKYTSISLLVIASLFSLSLMAAGDPPLSFTYQGKLFKANGRDPVEDPAVTFKVQVRTPDGLCVLFEETHFRDMTGKSGLFSLVIGEGSNTNATTLNLSQVFENVTAKTGANGCGYNPLAGDTRRLRFSYDNGTETVTMSTDQTIRSVPYAMTAMNIQGVTKDKLIQVSSQTTQARIDVLSGYYNQLVDLAAGTSTAYAKAGDLPIASGILNLSSGGVKVPDTPASNDSAVNKNYSDSKMGGKILDLTGLTNGQTLMWNAAQNKWQAMTITQPNVGTAGTYTKVTTDVQGRVTSGSNLASSDISSALGFSPLNKGGDTLTGAMNFNGQNLLNAGYITMSSGKYLGLGAYDAAAEASLVTNVLTGGGASYAGVTWYNSVSKSVKYWDGSQVVVLTSNVAGAIGSLNGLTGATQTLTIGSTGVSPTWASALGSHQLNIPAASTVGVTAGLLSNIDYAAFNAKQNALGYVPLDRAGTIGMSASLNMSADAGVTLNKIINLKNPTADQDAATKYYADHNVSGLPSNISSLNNTTDTGKILSWSGSAWTASTPNPGTVTSITAGAGLSGGTISSSGTISLPNIGTAGTYTKVTTDAYGRVSGGAALAASDIPTASGDVSGAYSNLVVAKIQGVAVGTSTPANNQVLAYNSSTSKWEPQTPISAPVSSVAGRTGAVTLSQSDISGTLDVAHGGTGQASYTSGQILIGNVSNGLTKATLTAGSGVSIVNGDGSITISAMGLGGTVSQVSVSSPLTVANATSTPAIALQAASGTGQSLIWNGSAWASSFANVSQLRGAALASQFPTTCTVAQTMTFSTVTDTYSCANIAVNSAQVSGLGSAALLNVGSSMGTVAAGDDSRLVNAVQNSTAFSGDLSGTHTSATVVKIRGYHVAVTAPTNGQVLKFNGATSTWEPAVDASNVGTVTSITPGADFTTSTPITGSGTLNINTGTSANQIVKLDSNAKLPAIDGSQLTNMPVVPFTTVVVGSGTSWTVPAGVKKVFVQVWGGGGGGAGGATLGTGGGGGGGGGYAAGFMDVSAVASVTISIGSAGAGAAAAGANGSAGGTSSFGGISAAGGAAGIAGAVTGATGGATLSGTITIAGGPGHVGNSAISVLGVVNLLGLGGAGGTAGGGGGIGGNGSLGAGTSGAGTTPGGGGGGGGSGYSSGAVGAAGGAGRILIWY